MSKFDEIEYFGKFFDGLTQGHGMAPAAPTPGGIGTLARNATGAFGSPILDAGQAVIAAMRLTTGIGDPERGEAFGHGATRFAEAGQTVGSAYPFDWEGTAAQTYASANDRQAHRIESLARLDRNAQTVVAREAYQVAYHREKLDNQSNFLGDLNYLTWPIALIPGAGRALKAAFELAAVKAAVSICSVELGQLAREVGDNADQLRELTYEYAALSEPTSGLDPSSSPERSDEPAQNRQSDHREPAQRVASRPAAGAAAMARSAAPFVANPSNPPARLAEPAPSTAPPAEMMHGLNSAMGIVGGMIGSVMTPIAAMLGGAVAAAGQLPSLSQPADVAAEIGETDLPHIEDAPLESASDDEDEDEDPESPSPAADIVPDTGQAVPDLVAEPEQPEMGEQQPRPSAPPAATRPPE